MNGTARATNDPANGTSGSPPNSVSPDRPAHVARRPEATALAAWEKFVGGEDTVQGVRPEILASWYRCREQYQVDPRLAQAPPAPYDEGAAGGPSLLHGTVFAELGGVAALAAGEAESVGGLNKVADS